jgi:hypothetical protein
MAKKEEPKVDEKVEKLKIKKPKKKKFEKSPEVVKVDLNELKEKAEEIVKVDLSKPVEEIKAPETQEETQEETPIIQEITDEVIEAEKIAKVVEKEVVESIETGRDLPESVQKLMNFMDDTGGDLNDYIKLNKDYSEMDNHTLLKEYYKNTKPHLQTDEIDFLMEDQFSFRFLNKTEEVFNDEFKGFEYKVGDKKYRFNVKDPNQVKESQSDINNFVKKFLNENDQMEDAAGYHKSMFTAMNSDAIANHFYEQGKADALKESMSKSKNIDMSPRESHGTSVNDSGIKMRVLGEDNSRSNSTFKIRKNK